MPSASDDHFPDTANGLNPSASARRLLRIFLVELGAAVIESFPELELFVKATEDWTLCVVAYRYPSAERPAEPEPGDEELNTR